VYKYFNAQERSIAQHASPDAGGFLMSMTKRETAEFLAKAHFQIEPNLKKVFILEPLEEDDPHKPIALLEIVEGTLERGIEPIGFVADPLRDIAYPLVIVDVSPREYEEIRQQRLSLQEYGWSVGSELRAE